MTALNTWTARTLRSIQLVDDEYVKDCLRAAARWLNQARAAQAQDDLGHQRYCMKKATWWYREANRYLRDDTRR